MALQITINTLQGILIDKASIIVHLQDLRRLHFKLNYVQV